MKNQLLLIWLCLLGVHWGMCQQNPSLSNLRKKTIPSRLDTLFIDSLSIVPGTFFISGIDSSDYSLDIFNARLWWKKKPDTDSITLIYRVFPGKLNTVSEHMRFDSISNNFLAAPQTLRVADALSNSIFDFGNINYNGSFGRGLSFGNQQDVVLNSTLNLQMNGYLADSIHLAAAITDSNIPIQPDGNTQNLNEFDKVFIQFKKGGWHFDIGDIDIRQQQHYFLNYYSRLQGAAFERESKIGTGITNRLLLSGAIAKGKYTRNVFNGVEGNQGPYGLQGPNNELFFIVLAGTERVYIDGELMQRGEDQDYVINYNTAEVTFTPRRMITKDKRIQVEFGYADRNYLNAQLYIADEATINKKLKIRVAAYSNSDAKNSPINQTLDPRQKQFLADVGDSVHQALYPSQIMDTFSVNKILYKKIDTVFNSNVHDSIYIYSVNPNDTLYNLAFTEVGQGMGDYIPDETSAANGKLFKWVAPDAGNAKQGRFAPVILLIAPKKQQLLSVGADYNISEHTQVSTELAVSSFDINSFSSKDKQNDKGYAAKLAINDSRDIKNNANGLTLISQLSFEWVQDRFKPVERLRGVEFYRTWGLPLNQVPSASENLFHAGIELKSKKGNSLRYLLETYNRNALYQGVRNGLTHRADYGNWHFNNQFDITVFNQNEQKGVYIKPVVDIAKDFPKMGNYRVGGGYTAERNDVRYKLPDSINTGSFSYEVWQVYLKSPLDKPNKWGATYFTRSDRYPYQSKLAPSDRSHNLNVYTELMSSERRQLKVNFTYRKLEILNDKVTLQKPESSVLGRTEYFFNELKGLISGNALYEVGTGQEQKRDFTYVEVPAGQGEYTWNDYNGNGIPELNEFELSQFRDQAKYIRIFTPTNEFVKANYLQFNYSVILNPRAAIDAAGASRFQQFLTRFYFQSTLQINKKENSGSLQFNPFAVPLSDTSLIVLNQVFSNSFSFNRLSTKWGVDVNNIRNSNKAFLTYGYESRSGNDWNIRGRWNITRSLLLELLARKTGSKLVTPNFDNRNYHIASYGVEPRLSFIKGTNFRAAIGYRYDDKRNKDSTQAATIHSVTGDVKYNVLSSSSLAAKFTYSQIGYSDPGNTNTPNTSVSYMMLDALLPGKNYLWTVEFTKRLNAHLELNFQYEGRKSGASHTVHIGRASIRAIF